MDSSVFVGDVNSKTPLLNNQPEYELLDDEGFVAASWESESDFVRQRPRQTFWPTGYSADIPGGSYGTDSETYTIECALEDVYRYYWIRGFWRFFTMDLGQIIIWTWLVLFCVFLGTCIDYYGIITVNTATSLWVFVHFGSFGRNWFFIMSLILYCTYFVWRVIKFYRDLRRMWKIRCFYRDVLNFEDFDLRTVRWGDVVKRIQHAPSSLSVLGIQETLSTLSIEEIASRIVAKENWFKRLLESGHIDCMFKFGNSTKLILLTRGLQWNVMYCIVNFFFGHDLCLKREYVNASPMKRIELATQLSKRILIIGCINILLIPFLVVFVALYAIFRYGEEFYKDPGNVKARQWSLAARWHFRDINEMPHVLEERLRLSTRFAVKYTEQFATGPIEGIARAVAFVAGSFVMWMLIMSMINEQVLLLLNVLPGKGFLWWITVFSALWVLCRGVLKEQYIFYPNDVMEVIQVIVRRLPEDFLHNAGSRKVLGEFCQLFPLRISLLLIEFAGVFVTPYILLARIRPKCFAIVDFFCAPSHTSEEDEDGEPNTDFELSAMQSDKLMEHIRRFNGPTGKAYWGDAEMN